jgi:hypothetical protein
MGLLSLECISGGKSEVDDPRVAVSSAFAFALLRILREIPMIDTRILLTVKKFDFVSHNLTTL